MSAIDDKYAQLGGPGGFLGQSLDEGPTADGGGSVRDLEHGSIYWSKATGAHELHGAIRDKWAELGGLATTGFPVTDETGTPDGVGRFNHFEHGWSIYWTPDTGAHEVHGDIRRKWEEMGWETSFLGYPTSDERPSRDGHRYSQFQGGTILWSAAEGTEVRKRIDEG